MQKLPEDAILKYRPDTLQVIRKLYHLDKPGQMDEAVDLLAAWITKQDHFLNKDFSREYLERVIILLKGSVERAKSQIDKLCSLRTALPKYFEVCDPLNELKELKGYLATSLLPNLTPDHYRIFIVRISPENHSARKFFLLYVFTLLVNEYIKGHDYSDGLVCIADLRGIHITDLIAELNLSDLRHLTTIAMEGYDTRVKSLHYISSSKAVDLLVKIVKSIMSSKMGDRIHVHQTFEEVYDFVPKKLLPQDYGGDEGTLDELFENMLKVFSSKENKRYWKMMRDARTDESRRRSAPLFSERDLGLEGTFRTLNVD